MKICGIIAEYNPFHNGHARHLAETRRALGENTALVCVMSGNYVQRGDLAMMEKHRRAEAAVRCGADLVLDMPLSACLSSAEGFARGGVSVLEALGCVTHLSFGSEAGVISPIRHAAALRDNPDIICALRRHLRTGLPYAAAMQQAVSAVDAEAGALYQNPNNTLGIAYCMALRALNSTIEPLTVLRAGAAHDAQTHRITYPQPPIYVRLLQVASFPLVLRSCQIPLTLCSSKPLPRVLHPLGRQHSIRR